MHRFFKFLVVAGLVITAVEPLAFSELAARDVLERFCELDALGAQLTPEGRKEIVALFVTLGVSKPSKITVVRDFVVSRPALEKDRAEFYVEYIQLGQITPSPVRFSPLPPLKVRAGFYLVPAGKLSEVGPNGKATRATGPPGWRIEGSPPEPHLTVDAAIRYASELRDRATDVGTRRHAEKTVEALKRLR